ncbi:hypothetical protein BDV97DRAFT_300525 [Delphinella strobiligena]|nr:hypothetical protein BDV97DRAFT_300525 [Delphinella strobiligena]
MWSQRSSQSSFDELYDVTDDDFEEVPIRLSASVKRQARESKERTRYPSLVIPSPSKWPSTRTLQSPCTIGLSPASKIAITPSVLATFNARRLPSPDTSSAPSLAGSVTSEEPSVQSCPSTPDIHSPCVADEEWDQPIQLDPRAFEVLHQLQPEQEDDDRDQVDAVITVSDEAIQEMQEIVKDTPVCHNFALSVPACLPGDPDEAISALTVPSPGGFFSSLGPCAAQTWSRHTPEPSTGAAEDFYGVPWRATAPPNLPSQHNLHLTIPRNESSSPVPAICLVVSPTEASDTSEITELCDPATYEEALKQAGYEHADRTKLWLTAQSAYLAQLLAEDSIIDDFQSVPGVGSTTPEQVSSPATAASPSKKSVRFVERALDAIVAEAVKAKDDTNEIVTTTDPVFYHAFQHIVKRTTKRDAFIHSQARAEAVHVQRTNFGQSHCKQLSGDYMISTPVRPTPVRPISSILPTTPDDDARRALIATAERERQALEQIKTSAWALQAETKLYGGKLLNSPTEKLLDKTPDAKILDFGGETAGSWGWQAALEYRDATVYTIPIPGEEKSNANKAKGPSNHRVLTVPVAWALPFPTATFDVISARTLHLFLKTSVTTLSPQTPASPNLPEEDEWDLALSELYRVLKPGGYLEFSVYDASLLHPGPLGLALSVEFTFNLRNRGYDASACRTLLPRLRKAGFNMIRRGWFVLPMADVHPRWTDAGKSRPGEAINGGRSSFYAVEKSIGPDGQVEIYQPPVTGSTAAVKAMTGLVGARAWEQWVLKLGAEMGRSDEQTMNQISRVFEEGGGEGGASGKVTGFKTVVGWCRK